MRVTVGGRFFAFVSSAAASAAERPAAPWPTTMICLFEPLKTHHGRRAPSPRLRGEGRGEGDSQRARSTESPPPPPPPPPAPPPPPRRGGDRGGGGLRCDTKTQNNHPPLS